MKREILLLLHDIRSVHNVGAIFRTADAVGVSKIYLSGYTPQPVDRFGRKRSDFHKAALGAEDSVSWEFVARPALLLKRLKKTGVHIVVLEQDERAVSYRAVRAKASTLLIPGNEVAGVPEKILALADVVAEIPMHGQKESLNVSVAVGIALYGIFKR